VSWRGVLPLARRRRSARVLRVEAEFLPAALEIQASPPSPLGRALALSLTLLLAAAAGWAVVGRVDVVAVARGRIIPTGHSKVVQPLDGGIVRAVHVRDGQAVRKGAVLIDLDPTARQADYERLVQERAAAVLHAGRLRALLAGEDAIQTAVGAPAALVALQRRLLADQRAEIQARIEAARLFMEQRRAAVEASRADVARLEDIMPILTERSEAFRTLLAGEYVARMQFLEVEQERITRAGELVAQRERLSRDLAALAEAGEQRRVVEIEFTRARLAELAEWEARATALEHDVTKAAQAARIQRLSAPVDGVVQQLAVHTIGGVVTSAQPLLVVVPSGGPLEVEAWIENRDVAFVRAGQPVEVKADSLPFTRYGTVAGEVLDVSRDAVAQERGGLVYPVRVSLSRASVTTEEGDVRLVPGMLVSVEIATGQRRLIEFLLSPLLRSWKEAARER
jgi:hemolysin D